MLIIHTTGLCASMSQAVSISLLQPLQTPFHRHILSNVGRVAARDSSRTNATVNDLFVALCEDDSIYGLFRTLKGSRCFATDPFVYAIF